MRIARHESERTTSHTLKIGAAVAVFGRSQTGQPFIEGSAVISATCPQPHNYRVCFHAEQVTRTRFVNPEWQRNPEHSLALLTEYWRSSLLPSFDDFFPHETT